MTHEKENNLPAWLGQVLIYMINLDKDKENQTYLETKSAVSTTFPTTGIWKSKTQQNKTTFTS